MLEQTSLLVFFHDGDSIEKNFAPLSVRSSSSIFSAFGKTLKKVRMRLIEEKKSEQMIQRYESIIYSTLIIGFSLLPLRRKFSSEIPIFLKAVFVASNLDQLLLVAWPFAEVTICRVLAGFCWLEMYMSAWLWAKLLSWQIIELKS